MFNFFKKSKKPETLKDALDWLGEIDKKVESLLESFNSLEAKNKFSIQKIGVVRYNPFSNVGGNQSFTVALLDDNDDGVIITSLYNHNGNTVYAKPVKEGKSEYSLSHEEKEAMGKAVKPKTA